jgi:hypothetical protein
MKKFLMPIVIIGTTFITCCTIRSADQPPEQPCVRKVGNKTILTKECIKTICEEDCKKLGYEFDPAMAQDFDIPADTAEQDASTLYVCPCKTKP